MTIEISTVDIICRIIAAISVILCIVLYFYDRHKTAKWFKENAKEENPEAPCYQKTSCLDCKMYDKENYYCPRFCEVIRNTLKEIEEENKKKDCKTCKYSCSGNVSVSSKCIKCDSHYSKYEKEIEEENKQGGEV